MSIQLNFRLWVFEMSEKVRFSIDAICDTISHNGPA